jgi:predicted metalloprotease
MPPWSAPPPRRSPVAVVSGVIVVLAAAFFVIAVVNYLQSAATPSPSAPETPSAVPSPSAPAPTPDAAPTPQTWEEATEWLRRNRLYQQSLPATVPCQAHRFDATTARLADLQLEVDASIDCLQQAWDGPVTAAGSRLPRPPGLAFDVPVVTACGDSSVSTAFYCALDQRIYVSMYFPRDLPRDLADNPFALADTMAHEYGHHVQLRTGIFVSAFAWKGQVDQKTALEYSRRFELQADCFDGLWLDRIRTESGLSPTELKELATIVYELGDDTAAGQPPGSGDHGQGKSRLAWYTVGREDGPQTGVCNTFSAPASTVR